MVPQPQQEEDVRQTPHQDGAEMDGTKCYRQALEEGVVDKD